MEKGYDKIYTPIKPLESYFRVEENEDMQFKLSKLKLIVESMKDEIKQELYSFKYDIHCIKGEDLIEIRVF